MLGKGLGIKRTLRKIISRLYFLKSNTINGSHFEGGHFKMSTESCCKIVITSMSVNSHKQLKNEICFAINGIVLNLSFSEW